MQPALYVVKRDDYSQDTCMWTSVSCSLPPIMAGAATYLPYQQSRGCSTRKWGNCNWRPAKSTIGSPSTGDESTESSGQNEVGGGRATDTLS
ncbi:hypothetical protein PIB30_023427 [Stylosanthes scabra]|uniref:Uncharacterized protein n=1 Tax=Stylosanthes scabra TaxID=79078 RepID=A0ABU6Z928_9FABA|nr:hypothetical protein [Stylosanthes scabra]